MVIDQAVKESFRFRNIDEIADRKQKVLGRTGEAAENGIEESGANADVPTIESLEKNKFE